ncbi:hypothetical protein D3C84_1252290 [compost metagenome]
MELIQRCEELGLVQRDRNQQDKRSIFISLTDKGMGLLEELSEIHVDELERAGLLTFEQLQ